MLEKIKQWLKGTQSFPAGELKRDSGDEQETAVAVCVLLLETAAADETLCMEEKERILEIIRERFQLSPEEAQALVEQARNQRKEAFDLFQFTSRINHHYTPEERTRLLEEIWRVIYADGILDAHEDYLVHKFARLLNLPQSQLIAAKMRIKEKEA